MVQLTVSEAERQGLVDRILRSLLSFFCLFYDFFSFLYFIPFIYYYHNHFSLYVFLIMIFPLLVSGVQVSKLCWVGQQPAVFAAVG